MSGAETLREAAALMRERAEARKALPAGAWRCDRRDHPARPHGHYGHGGRHWCDDFGSPLLSEKNMGSRRVYAKLTLAPDVFHIGVADLLDVTARDVGTSSIAYHAALAVARAYLGERP